MDKSLPRKNNKKLRVLGIAVGIILLVTLSYTTFFQEAVLNVSRSELRVKEVVIDHFEDYISFQAQVEPLHAMLVNIVEGGAVQELFIENGAMVEKGTPLARLYNPNTEFSYLSQETAIIEQMNNLNVSKLDIRNQELGLSKDLVSMQHDYNVAEQNYVLNEKLYRQEVLSLNEWTESQERFRFQKERKQIIEESMHKEMQTNKVQLSQIDQALHIMSQSLEKLRENKQNFLLLAPISGRLSSFEAILGKTYQAGESIGKIDVLKGYKLVANVDEFYLEKVELGQQGQISLKDQMVLVTVSKVLPEVKSGRFEVELQFEKTEGIKLQQGTSFGVKLSLSDKETKLLLPKGTFYSDTNGAWVYVVKGNRAERRAIELGRENPSYYEVLSGLEEGEEVIVSGYKNYLRVEKLNIQ